MRPEERDPGLVWDMRRACRDATRVLADRPEGAIARDRVLQLALERSLEILGEAARGVSQGFRERHPEVEWEPIARQRHVIAHHYGAIDHVRLERVVREHVPELATRLDRILRDLGVPPTIGIAGGIGGGKSAVARALAALGCVVSDSDADARAVLEDPEVKAAIVARFGAGTIAADGTVDRAALGRIVFAHPEARRALEALTHPRIEAIRRRRFADALVAAEADPSRAVRAFVIDAPLLFEAGLDAECDAVIFVDASRAVRLARVQAARGWDDAELARREAAQLPVEEKRRRATHVVANDGDEAALHAAVARVLALVTGQGG